MAYTIMVNDPLTVNQLLRLGAGPSAYEIAVTLVKNGCSFKTALPYDRPSSLMWPAPPIPMFSAKVALGLGVRPIHDRHFTQADYQRYLELRDDVLRSYDGRAAFLAGGILWRLAVDGGADEARVLNGPSERPHRENWFEFEGTGYVDDLLNQHQAEVICGVYRIKPGT